MITKIKINGFKSFHNFEMSFTPFTVIAGTNASGKSNLFDALILLSKLAETDNIKRALSEQRGEFLELFTMYDLNHYSNMMEFEVEMLVNKKVKDAWGNEAVLKYTRLRYHIKLKRFINKSGLDDVELIYESLVNLKKNKDDEWVKYIPKSYTENWIPKVEGNRGKPYLDTIKVNEIDTVSIHQDGSKGGSIRHIPLVNANRTVLSSIDTVDFKHILAAKEEMRSWKFLQLNPDDLREPTSKNNGEDEISQTGKNLAAALFRISQNNLFAIGEISRKLNQFLPNFVEVKIVDDKENRQYIIKLIDVDKKEYTSRVLSEGTLRILTLCILEYDEEFSGLLCFEEPENGINPQRVSTMLDLLTDLSSDFSDDQAPLRQVIVNTHSPVLVGNLMKNYKNDQLKILWFSQMRISIINVDDKKYKIETTKIVLSEKTQQATLFKDRVTFSDIQDYLNMGKFDLIV
ncbi:MULTISPECIES: AAA family ATPase [Chryseobacterium]|uniref:Predicted ATPase n=1 Tax=Chryseobacterium indoltheticum TaxID=254 RepID=A0A381FF56_9FLAO|nr:MULTISPECIES: AAA family ATPase [Chryseobacterium]MDQ8144276.1 AAA family ATPase [Chryseobacterium sp. CFS15]SUX45185.1 Predicted ATPase [Chryseobacterium indoltheticum]